MGILGRKNISAIAVARGACNEDSLDLLFLSTKDIIIHKMTPLFQTREEQNDGRYLCKYELHAEKYCNLPKKKCRLIIRPIENIIASSANTVQCNDRAIIRHSTAPHNIIFFGKDGKGRVHGIVQTILSRLFA